MVQRKTVEGWGYNSPGFELNEEGDVSLMFCKPCKEFYSSESQQKELSSKYKGKFLEQANAFVKGTNTIKKNNFEIHLKSQNHKDAILRLKEQQILNQGGATYEQTETVKKESGNSGAPCQTLLKPMIQTLTSCQQTQLGKKVQLTHFICAKAKSFNSYAEFANFEKKFHNDNLGNGYLNDKSCAEIIKYISLSNRMKKITKPLNKP